MRVFLLIIAVFLIVTGCSSAAQEVLPSIVNGTADFSSISLSSENRLVPLKGEWTFVPGKLIGPDDPTPTGNAVYVDVPRSWEYLHAMPGLQGGSGFGTYRLRIHLNPGDVDRNLGLLVEPIASSYRLWVNGKLLRVVGTVGTSSITSMPKETMEHVHFVTTEQELRIDIQVSNFVQRKGGIWSGLYIGNEIALEASFQRNMVRELVSAGALLMMGIFYLAFAGLYLPERSTLFLGALSILFAFRIFFLGEVLVASWFPGLSWNWRVKLEYLIEIAAILSMCHYMRAVYLKEFSRFVLNFIRVFEAAFALVVLVTPSLFFTQWMVVHVSVVVIAGLYVLGFVYPKAIRRRRLGARSGMIAISVTLAAIVNDTFYYLSIPFASEDMVYAGFFVYLLSQMVVTIRRYVRLREESDTLTLRLAASNEELERNVSERTRQLTESHRSNSRLMQNIAHDLRAPISLICHRVEHLKAHVLPEGVTHLSVIEQQSEWAIKLAQNLSDLASFQENEMRFSPAEVKAVEFMRFLYKRMEPVIRSGGFQWTHKPLDELFASDMLFVHVDMFLIERVLDNLISNSLKFAIPGRNIGLSYRLDGRVLEIIFENDTHLLTDETMDRMFERFYKADASGLGSGIGLAVCREIVQLHGGEIRVFQPEADKICFVIRLSLDSSVKKLPKVIVDMTESHTYEKV